MSTEREPVDPGVLEDALLDIAAEADAYVGELEGSLPDDDHACYASGLRAAVHDIASDVLGIEWPRRSADRQCPPDPPTPSLSLTQAIAVAEATLFSVLEQCHSPPSREELHAIARTVLASTAELAEAERACVDAALAAHPYVRDYEDRQRLESARADACDRVRALREKAAK